MARTRFTVKEGISVADDNSAGGYPLVPVGSLIAYAAATSPEGWLLCDGTAINRTTYANLFALIGTTYGSGNGTTTFNVPDMRSRMPIGAGAGTGLTSRTLAATGGTESVVVASGNLPTHTHSIAHDHASATSGAQSVDHSHSVNPPNTTSTGASVDHTHDVDPPITTSGGQSANHTHDSDPPGTGSGIQSANHSHSVYSYGSHEHRLYFFVDAASGTAKGRVSAAATTLTSYGITEYAGGHDHSSTSNNNVDHSHYTDVGNFGSGNQSADHTHATNISSFVSSGHSVDHSHNTDIAAFDSAGASVGHTHAVDLPNFTGDSGNGGFANTALGLMNPFLSVNYIIKY
jgi:microcystin-dependent protein